MGGQDKTSVPACSGPKDKVRLCRSQRTGHTRARRSGAARGPCPDRTHYDRKHKTKDKRRRRIHIHTPTPSSSTGTKKRLGAPCLKPKSTYLLVYAVYKTHCPNTERKTHHVAPSTGIPLASRSESEVFLNAAACCCAAPPPPTTAAPSTSPRPSLSTRTPSAAAYSAINDAAGLAAISLLRRSRRRNSCCRSRFALRSRSRRYQPVPTPSRIPMSSTHGDEEAASANFRKTWTFSPPPWSSILFVWCWWRGLSECQRVVVLWWCQK